MRDSAGDLPPSAIDTTRGVVRLVVDGIHGVTHIAEGLHGNIARLAPPLGRVREQGAGGIAGFVYRTVRASSGFAGSSLDVLLAAAGRGMRAGAHEGASMEVPKLLALRAALNGVVGDHLARTNNPLAIGMELFVRGPVTPRLLLLVHGLCLHEGQWMRNGHDHGQALAAALGCTPVYVRYNSGRHVSENGAELAARLERLVGEWSVRVESIAIVGHSMGGLVARSAVAQAAEAGLRWPKRLRQMVFLGTPHHGAALERGGNRLHTVLGLSPYLAPFTRLGHLRSDGITDLRHGNVVAADWRPGRYVQRDTRTVVPLPKGVACFAVAGAVGSDRAAAVLGDGLVSVDSALGRHPRPSHLLRFAPGRTWVAQGTHHLELLGDLRVYARFLGWLRP
jgi:pimeloyl-ACP methyl ester carboxylesterase